MQTFGTAHNAANLAALIKQALGPVYRDRTFTYVEVVENAPTSVRIFFFKGHPALPRPLNANMAAQELFALAEARYSSEHRGWMISKHELDGEPVIEARAL